MLRKEYECVISDVINRMHTLHPNVSTTIIQNLRERHLKAFDVVWAIMHRHIQADKNIMAIITPATAQLVVNQFNEIQREMEETTRAIAQFTEKRDSVYPDTPTGPSMNQRIYSHLTPITYDATWITRSSLIQIWTAAHRLTVALLRVHAYTCGTREQWLATMKKCAVPSPPMTELLRRLGHIYTRECTNQTIMDTIDYLEQHWIPPDRVRSLQELRESVVGLPEAADPLFRQNVLLYLNYPQQSPNA